MEPKLELEHPRKVTVVESIVEQIVRQIQMGKLKPGDKLPSERQLIEMLGVSRSSVREALQGLAMMGVVESRPGQGTFVSHSLPLLVPDIDNPALSENLQREMRLKLVEARRVVEGSVARLAAARATEQGLARLKQHLETYEQAMRQQSLQDAYKGSHHDFHIALAEMTQNPFFGAVVETLLRAVPLGLRVRELTRLVDPDPRRVLEREVELHRTIYEAVVRRDPDAAQKAMEAHMAFEEELILQVYQHSKGEPAQHATPSG